MKVFVLRLDLIHPFVSGNKWYKLKYNIEEFRRLKKDYLVTFGGAYSNHIVATAEAGEEFGIKTIGIIRGEELSSGSNEVLRFASECGMRLIFVTRENYRALKNDFGLVAEHLSEQLPNDSELLIVAEGGSNGFALEGCEDIIDEITIDFDYIVNACGTGMTLSGIAKSLKPKQQAIGISILQGEDFLEKDISSWITATNYKVVYDYHFGGYAKKNLELQEFCSRFSIKHKVPIEPVYTGKLFYGLNDLIMKDFFEKDKTVIAIHSGGIFDFKRKPSANISVQ